ncbi:S-layer homology domain-containing protein [Oceanobacillus massiliensis]|uniref:S-layer homology domain-containing protein n=1 Tax=Oceanobacillus massiliensis TaxID=1465765 RepID=UPI0013760EA3|nr:S-layer homology domain-containing protein [Oceanobacillus massiliensis]
MIRIVDERRGSYIKTRRLPIYVVLLAMVLSLFAPRAFASDDISGHYFENDMRALIEKGVIVGYSDGTYKPNRHVTRAEFTIFLVRSLEISQASQSVAFNDVDKSDWYYSAIASATAHDLINGYPDGSFKPNENISRQEMAAMVQRALAIAGISAGEAPLDFVDTPDINPIYYSAIQQLLYLDIMVGKIDKNGNTSFHPMASTTRGEAAAILNRLLSISETGKEIVTTTHYDLDFNEMVNIQMTKTPKVDGSGIYLASEELVSYYANPNNYSKGSSDYLQFLILSQNAGLNAQEINEKVLKGKGILEGQGQAFIDAGKKYNVNEVYLIAHALHETGNGTSQLAKGILVSTVDGKSVYPKKTYNMYGIRAYDSNPLRLGSEHAYKEGWFTPRDAIIGGAAFIADGYINSGQDTLYKMRWNPSSPGYPQYATHVSWAVLQTTRIQEIYNLLDSYVLKYDVPTFNHQPGKTSKPSGELQYHVDLTQNGKIGVTTANLNLRKGPTTSFNIIHTLGTDIPVTLIGENGGWYKVNANGTTGWVSSAYIRLNRDLRSLSSDDSAIGRDAERTDSTEERDTGVIPEEEASPDSLNEDNPEIDQTFDQYPVKLMGKTNGDNVHLRTEPDSSNPETIITKIPIAAEVQIKGKNEKGWYLVVYGEQEGWILSKFIDINNLLQIVGTETRLNVRSESNDTSEIIGKIVNGDHVFGIADENGELVHKDNWVQIIFEDQLAWIYGDFVKPEN